MPSGQLPLDIKLREDATFANYIGEAQRYLTRGDVFIIYGAAGSGKSHVLQAACHEGREEGLSAFYMDEPHRHDPAIVDGLESFDPICIDGVDTVLGVEAWETALFHLINAVRDSGRTLLLATRLPPSALRINLPDLRSRMLAARAIETDVLSDEQKLRLLKEKARRQGFELGDEVGRFILSRSDRSSRALIDLLTRIEVATLARQRHVTIPLVKSVLDAASNP